MRSPRLTRAPGLLTIERDKVYAHVWFQAKTTSTIQKITLPKDFEGNGYLNVAFVRGAGLEGNLYESAELHGAARSR